MNSETCLHSKEFQLAPYFADNFQSVNALVLGRVTTSIPNFRLKRQIWPFMSQLILADPDINFSRKIDLLIEIDYLRDLIEDALIQGPLSKPRTLPTKLGYVLIGPTTIYHIMQE